MNKEQIETKLKSVIIREGVQLAELEKTRQEKENLMFLLSNLSE